MSLGDRARRDHEERVRHLEQEQAAAYRATREAVEQRLTSDVSDALDAWALAVGVSISRRTMQFAPEHASHNYFSDLPDRGETVPASMSGSFACDDIELSFTYDAYHGLQVTAANSQWYGDKAINITSWDSLGAAVALANENRKANEKRLVQGEMVRKRRQRNDLGPVAGCILWGLAVWIAIAIAALLVMTIIQKP